MQLESIDRGSVEFNFPLAKDYRRDMPRQTVVKTLIEDIRRNAPSELPFLMEN